MRIDTIKIKEVVDCFAISQRLSVAEVKVTELKEWRKWFIVIIGGLLFIAFIYLYYKFKPW